MLFCFPASVLKQRRTRKAKAGDEINGLAKERGSFIQGLERMNPGHEDGGVKHGVHFKRGNDTILFSFYPHRLLAPTAASILQRGNPCWLCLESPRARLTWIRGEEGDDGEKGIKRCGGW